MRSNISRNHLLNRDRAGADTVVRQRTIQFVRTQVWRAPGEIVGDGRKNGAGIHGAGTRLQSKIEILRSVEMLRIGLVWNSSLHKNIEINQYTMLLLPCRVVV